LRFLPLTASALTLPPLIIGIEVAGPSNISATWPPITACSAGGEPLYGTWFRSVPAAWFSASPIVREIVPALYDAYDSGPGWALA
jgi:hypothetical protein